MLHTGEIESTPDPSVFKLSDLEFPIKCKNNLIMGKQKTKGGLMAYRINPPQVRIIYIYIYIYHIVPRINKSHKFPGINDQYSNYSRKAGK